MTQSTSDDQSRFQVLSFFSERKHDFPTNQMVLSHFGVEQALLDDLVSLGYLRIVSEMYGGIDAYEITPSGHLALRTAQEREEIALTPHTMPSPTTLLTQHNYGVTQVQVGDDNRLEVHERSMTPAVFGKGFSQLRAYLQSLPPHLRHEALPLLEAAYQAQTRQATLRLTRTLASLRELLNDHPGGMSLLEEIEVEGRS